MIIPNSNSSRGALRVESSTGAADTATISFGGITKQLTVNLEGGESGGGGGGVVRPGLVLNILAGSSIFTGATGGGGADGAPPATNLAAVKYNDNFEMPSQVRTIVDSFDPDVPIPPISTSSVPFDYPISIDGDGYAIAGHSNTIQTKTLETNKPVSMDFVVLEQNKISLFEVYLNLKNGEELYGSDTYISYSDGKVTVHDPNGYLANVDFDLTERTNFVKDISIDLTFAKELETSDIAIRSSDIKRRTSDTYILDAIEVIPGEPTGNENSFTSISTEELQSPTEETLDTSTEKKTLEIPPWVRDTAEWWADGFINDEDFVSGVEFMIEQEIIFIPNLEKSEETTEQEIPTWVRSNAEWWASGQITDEDFATGLEYLVKKGIIVV